MRCDDCPVPPGLACRGEALRNRRCGDATYREYFVRFASSPPPPLPRIPGPDLLRNARGCPSREPIPEGDREGCGCSMRCDAGRSRRENGGVTVLDCWACPIAPRLSWPAPPEEGGGG